MPKYTKDIKIGRRYTCKIRSKDCVVRVKEIDTSGYKNHSTVRIICNDDITNKIVIFRSPSRLIAELGERIPKFK
jgi:hypothetical protein